MEKPLTILLLADGRSVHTERYATALRGRAMTVWVASLEPGDMVDIPLKGKLGIAGLDYVFIAGQLSEIVKKHGIDIVDAHSASGYGFSAAVSRVWKTAPLVLHCLGSDILISARKSAIHLARVRTSLGRAAIVFSDSEYMSSKIREIDSDANIKIKYWGAEKAVFDVYHRKSEWNFVKRAVIDILVPRPQEEVYNNELIVEALSDMITARRMTLTFPGWGSRLEGFEALVRAKFNTGQVRFYDRLSRTQYPEFLSGFDVYLSASRSDSSPASLIEAMAAGLFPIVGDIDGVKEWMDDKSGLMFDTTSAASLKQAFEKLLSGQVEPEKIIQGNREKAERRGHFEEGIETTIKVMQELHHA